MTEPRQIAVVRDYPALLEALRQRAVELRVTRKQIAEIAGIAEGYAGTLLTPHSRKSFGLNTMGPILGALGIALLVIEDEQALKYVKNRLGEGNQTYMRNGGANAPLIFKLSRRRMRYLAKLASEGRKKIPPWKRRQLARRAARARWRKAKRLAAESVPGCHGSGTSPAAAPPGPARARRRPRSSGTGGRKAQAPQPFPLMMAAG